MNNLFFKDMFATVDRGITRSEYINIYGEVSKNCNKFPFHKKYFFDIFMEEFKLWISKQKTEIKLPLPWPLILDWFTVKEQWRLQLLNKSFNKGIDVGCILNKLKTVNNLMAFFNRVILKYNPEWGGGSTVREIGITILASNKV